MALVHMTEKNFESEALKSNVPVIVDFWADWCPPCKMLAPVFEELSSEYSGKLKFAKLNTDEASGIAQKYGVMSIPTLILFKGGKEAGRIVGAMPKQELKKRIDSLL